MDIYHDLPAAVEYGSPLVIPWKVLHHVFVGDRWRPVATVDLGIHERSSSPGGRSFEKDRTVDWPGPSQAFGGANDLNQCFVRGIFHERIGPRTCQNGAGWNPWDSATQSIDLGGFDRLKGFPAVLGLIVMSFWQF